MKKKDCSCRLGLAGPLARTFHFYPVITSFPMDNEDGDRMNGTNAKRKGMNGRLSTNTKTYLYPETTIGDFEVRDSKLMAMIARKCEEITVQKLYYCHQQSLVVSKAGKKKAKASADEENQWLEFFLEKDYFGVTAGINQNYKLVNFVESIGIINYCLLFGPDKLHTFMKGAVENIISWTILVVQSFDRVLGTSGLTELDERLKKFPTHQAFSPVRPVKFTDGISGFMKAESLKGTSRGQSTGHVSCKS